MADCAEKNRVEFSQFLNRARRKQLAGFLVALAAEIVLLIVQFHVMFGASRVQHFHAFAHHFRPRAVAGNHGNIVRSHIVPFSLKCLFMRVTTLMVCHYAAVSLHHNRLRFLSRLFSRFASASKIRDFP